MSGPALARAAAGFIGCPWRLHGRDPDTGLDCIGLLEAALVASGHAVVLPTGYPLRLLQLEKWLPNPGKLGFAAINSPFEAGDVILLRLGPAQIHLAIAAGSGGWIHAHAGVRKIVHEITLPPGELLGSWRLIQA